MVSNPSNWFEKFRQRPAADAEGWEQCAGLTMAQAEQLLDWLEANGVGQRELVCEEGEHFTVRWRR